MPDGSFASLTSPIPHSTPGQTQPSDTLITEAAPALIGAAPDAQLLRLGQMYAAAVAVSDALDTQDDDEASQQAYDKVAAIEDQIEAMKATTIQGLLVKVRVLHRIYEVAEQDFSNESLFHQAFHDNRREPMSGDQLVIGSIVRDMVAMLGAEA